MMFKVSRKSYFFLIYIITFCFISCRKESEQVHPVVKVSIPYENQIFTVLDTVQIQAQISHVKPLKSISMAIVDMDLKAVSDRFNLSPEDNEYQINSNIIINNIELSTANYYLHIRASDGENETNSYTKIYIYELPRILEDIFIISKTSYGSVNISKLDSSFQLIPIFSINSDFGYADIDPINKLLYISGKFNNKIYCIDYQNNIELWNRIVPGYSPLPYFNDLQVHHKKCYIAIRQSALMAYNSSGTLVYNQPTNSERYPVKLHFHKQYIVSSQQSISKQNIYIVMQYLESGSYFQQLQSSIQLVNFYTKDDNNIFIFGNDVGNNAEVRIYEIDNNGVWEPYNFTNGKIVACEMVDNNTFFVAYENKILRYSFNPPGSVDFVANIQTRSMRYDAYEQKLYVATKDKRLLQYSYPFGILEQQNSINDSICELLLVYNR